MNRRVGFSLLELVLSISLFAIISVVILQVSTRLVMLMVENQRKQDWHQQCISFREHFNWHWEQIHQDLYDEVGKWIQWEYDSQKGNSGFHSLKHLTFRILRQSVFNEEELIWVHYESSAPGEWVVYYSKDKQKSKRPQIARRWGIPFGIKVVIKPAAWRAPLSVSQVNQVGWVAMKLIPHGKSERGKDLTKDLLFFHPSLPPFSHKLDSDLK